MPTARGVGTEPIPLAIIEAKREDLPPEHGLQQGKGYRIPYGVKAILNGGDAYKHFKTIRRNSSARFTAQAGMVSITCDSPYSVCGFPATVLKSGSFEVSAKRLWDVVKAFKDRSQIDFEAEGSTLRVSRISIPVRNYRDLPDT